MSKVQAKEEVISKDVNVKEILNKRVRVNEKNSDGAWVEFHECSYFITDFVPAPVVKSKVSNKPIEVSNEDMA